MAKKKSTSRSYGSDRVIVVNTGGGQSSPSPSSGGSRSGIGGIIGPILGIGLLAGAAYLGYTLYQQYQCPTQDATQCVNGSEQKCSPWPMSDLPLFNTWQDDGNTCSGGGDAACTNPAGADGIYACNGGVNQQCKDGVWVAGGNKCSGTHIKGSACSNPGAGYCGGDTKYYVCENDGFSYSDGTPCANANSCLVLGCQQSYWRCGGVISGDSANDLYTDYRCNPNEDVCNFMSVEHNSPSCASRVPGAIYATVNGFNAINGGLPIPQDLNLDGTHCNCGLFGCGNDGTQHADIVLTVRDSKGSALGGATVTVQNVSNAGIWGGFVNPNDSSDHAINCGEYFGSTGADGTIKAKWVWVWEGGALGNDQAQTFLVTATANGVSVQAKFQLLIHGKSDLGQWTCDGITYGSPTNCTP